MRCLSQSSAPWSWCMMMMILKNLIWVKLAPWGHRHSQMVHSAALVTLTKPLNMEPGVSRPGHQQIPIPAEFLLVRIVICSLGKLTITRDDETFNTHTHTFHKAYPLESLWLENSSYSTMAHSLGYSNSVRHAINYAAFFLTASEVQLLTPFTA